MYGWTLANLWNKKNLGGGAVKTRNGSSVIRLYSNVLEENSVAAAKHIPQLFAQNNEDNGDEERKKERHKNWTERHRMTAKQKLLKKRQT